MRRPIACALLIACTALLAPQNAVSQEPAGAIVPAAEAPSIARWTARAQGNQRMPTRPGVMVPKIEVTAQAPSNVNEEPTGSSEITREVDAEIQPVADADSFLLPTWDRGFWVMPPGGFTRFLLPPPGFINPEMCHPSP